MTISLHETTDAAVWAAEFCKRFPSALCQVPGREGVTDGDDFEGIMIGWFANAIMAGVDSEARKAVDPATIRAEAWEALIADAVGEAEKAMRKFPQPNYVISKFAEESGEVVKAAIHCAEGRETAQNLRGEMKQALAMLYRLWVEGDQIHGLSPVSALIDKEQDQ